MGCSEQIALHTQQLNQIGVKMDTLISRMEVIATAIKCQKNHCDERLEDLETFKENVVSVGKVGVTGATLAVAITALWRFFVS